MTHQQRLTVQAPQSGLFDITARIREVVEKANIQCGMCHVFVQHTSCSLVIQENADPSARQDLENWLARLAPENDPLYTHTLEGPDDMPAHLRAAVTHTSENIPIVDGALGLGTWQGLYLWEHRRHTSPRQIVVTIMGE
ncbi:MAG: YjbQ family protein [Deltaproteobacteria bacterium]|nr:YjbQ family protein [Deltaproteobacteria bacterium]MBT6436259.1 YjbQ family protein [Deltaproteobacteria bacterium]